MVIRLSSNTFYVLLAKDKLGLMFDDFFQAATNVDHQAHEAPSSNLQLILKVLMMTIILLKLHMNNDPSSGVPFSKPDFEDSHSSWIVVPSKVHS